MPTRGDLVLPSSDSDINPAALAVAERLLLEINCPRREKGYTTGHLATDIGDEEWTWRRRFAGTRAPLKNLIDYLEAGDSLEVFLDDFPSVRREQAVAAFKLANEFGGRPR